MEREETLNYQRRMRRTWVRDIEGLVNSLHGTEGESVVKPYITDAPALVVVFEHRFGLTADGQRHEIYYPKEGCGIAVGLFIAALQVRAASQCPFSGF